MPRGKPLSTQIVLDKACELARRDGIESVTYNGLARELGIRPQSMYRYVPDVRTLRASMLHSFLNGLVDTIDAATRGLAPADALRAFAVTMYDECHAHPCYYEAFDLMHLYGLIGEMTPVLTRMVGLVRRPIEQVKASPEEQDRCTQLVMAVILGYAQMAKTEFIVESLADEREAYVRSIEALIGSLMA